MQFTWGPPSRLVQSFTQLTQHVAAPRKLVYNHRILRPPWLHLHEVNETGLTQNGVIKGVLWSEGREDPSCDKEGLWLGYRISDSANN